MGCRRIEALAARKSVEAADASRGGVAGDEFFDGGGDGVLAGVCGMKGAVAPIRATVMEKASRSAAKAQVVRRWGGGASPGPEEGQGEERR